MSKELDIVLEKVYGHTDLSQIIREDTYTSLDKIDEMKSSWSDLFNAVPDIAADYIRGTIKNKPKEEPKTDTNTSVKNMARRGKPEMPAQSKGEAPKKIEPVQTPSQGLGSKPVEAPKADKPEPAKAPESKTSMSFKQAFAKARKEAGGGKGQFEYGGKKYQTNINPAKGAEKYISATKQKATSVKVPKADTSAPKDDTPKDNKPETPKVEPLRNLRQQPPPTAQNMPKTKEDQEKSNAQGNDTYQKTRDNLDSPEASKERHDKEKGREDAANKVLEPLRKGLDAVEKLPGGDTIKKFTGDVKTNPSTQNESVQVGNYKYRII
jgi:hypothetical protein